MAGRRRLKPLATSPSGVILPAFAGGGVHQASMPAELAAMGTYLTYSDLTGLEMNETQLIARLEKLSVEDCLAWIAHLTTRMTAVPGPYFDPSVQQRLIQEVAGDGPLGQVLRASLDRPQPTTVFSEQQLVHLARLAILHADPRPHDDFDGGKLYDEWITCLIGVTDLLDSDLRVENLEERLSWELRQCGLNHHEDQLPIIAVHHEVYRELWPQLRPESAADVEEAFARHAGMALGDYFMIGTAVQARFTKRGLEGDELAAIEPARYFSTVDVSETVWRAFFDLVSRDLPALRHELRTEEKRYGATTYGSLSIERFPLVELEPGRYLPLSMPSLQRRITQGVFHILAEAAEAEGLDRRTYTSPFGDAFQVLVEQTLRRGVEASGSPCPIEADVWYGPKARRRRSSDVIMSYERYPVFVEVVSGPLQAGTITRGDLDCFGADLDRLVAQKGKQLDTSIADFFEKRLTVGSLDPALVREVLPVIVTSHSFPHAATINEAVAHRVRDAGRLQGERIGPLAIVSAEELCFCEGFMERGRTFLSLIRGWKSGPMSGQSFKNYLMDLGGGRAPGSDHAERQFAAATAEYAHRLFGSELTVEETLERLRGDGEDDV